MENLITISDEEVRKVHEVLNSKRKPKCCDKPLVDIEKNVFSLIPASNSPSDIESKALVSTCKNCGEIRFYAPHILGIELN